MGDVEDGGRGGGGRGRRWISAKWDEGRDDGFLEMGKVNFNISLLPSVERKYFSQIQYECIMLHSTVAQKLPGWIARGLEKGTPKILRMCVNAKSSKCIYLHANCLGFDCNVFIVFGFHEKLTFHTCDPPIGPIDRFVLKWLLCCVRHLA